MKIVTLIRELGQLREGYLEKGHINTKFGNFG